MSETLYMRERERGGGGGGGGEREQEQEQKESLIPSCRKTYAVIDIALDEKKTFRTQSEHEALPFLEVLCAFSL